MLNDTQVLTPAFKRALNAAHERYYAGELYFMYHESVERASFKTVMDWAKRLELVDLDAIPHMSDHSFDRALYFGED